MSKKQEPHEVYDVEFGQQSISVEGDKAKLPKFVLPRGESLYLSYDEVSELNDKYYTLVDNLNESGGHAPAELRSVMESVIILSYLQEIGQRRAKNSLEFELESKRIESLNAILTPRRWRKWFFMKKRNEAQILLDELVSRQAEAFLQRKDNELPPYPSEEDNVELQPFMLMLETLRESLPRMRKKRRADVAELIERLSYGYDSKVDQVNRLVAELDKAKKAVSTMEERAMNAEGLLEEFLKESSPASEEEAEPPKAKPVEESEAPEQKESEAKCPDENSPEEEEESKSADEEEDEGLSYDGLDEELDSE